MSRSYSLLVSITAILALSIGGRIFAYKAVTTRRFQTVKALLFNMPKSEAQLDGRWGDATLRVSEDVPLDSLALIETCGLIRRLDILAHAPSSQAIARLLTLPGLREVNVRTSIPLSDDAIAAMCQQGREIREINLQVHSISRVGLSRLAELPALAGA
ncbi:MAG TPA: hypothetical protein VGG30_05265 [Pirellulales bacterium]|jgi:hypothetical protein